jgi:hypothetical protein
MTLACRTCRRVNPPDAAYCFFDGVALDSRGRQAAAPPGTEPFPMPFTFASGRISNNYNELALACHNDGPSARLALRQGHLEQFLGGLGRLDLAQAAREAARFPDAERGLDMLLGRFPGDVLTPGKLMVKTPEIGLGTLAVGTDRRFSLTLENGGMRLLYGSVTVEDAPWLSLADSATGSEKLFQFDGRLAISVNVVGKALRAGSRPLEGRLVVSSNGGSATVPVRAEVPVRPFPAGALQGALTPRQVAEKAKAAPKEAAALFESGAVERWYGDNGWTYPVQGPSASGLGAVQQFFEALGLTKAPKVTLNAENLLWKGRPGETIRDSLRAEAEGNRPVFAHAFSDRSWLTVGRVELKGRVAVIPLTAMIPQAPGETLSARVTVRANGNQRFVVPVTLTVSGRRSAVRPYRDDEDAVPTVVPVGAETGVDVLPLVDEKLGVDILPTAGEPLRANVVAPAGPPMQVEVLPPADDKIQVDVLPLADSPAVVPPPVAPPPVAPPRRRTAVPPAPPVAPSGGAGLLHLLPLAVFALIFVGLIIRDLFVSGEADLMSGSESAPVVEIDPTPQIEVKSHDALQLDPLDATVPASSMRFGVVMLAAADAQGDPKRLTFDPWGRTNGTCIKIDNNDALLGGELPGPNFLPGSGEWEERAATQWKDPAGQDHQGTKSVWSVKRPPVRVTQTVEVVPGEITQDAKGRLVRYRDTCLVRYVLENRDRVAHTVGLRFLLDTFIGANDGVPFVIPGEAGLCDTMKDFGAARTPVPGYIEAQEFDDPARPGTVAHVQFKIGDPIQPPDRVTLGAWPHPKLAVPLRDRRFLGAMTRWDVPLHPIATAVKYKVPPPQPDSAVVMYWNPQRLEPGKSREVGFAYGLGKVSSAKGGNVNFLLTGDAGAVEGHDFTVQAVVSRPQAGQTLTLTPGSGLELAQGSTAAQQVPAVVADSARQSSTVTWQVRAVHEGVRQLEVKSSSGGSQKHTVRVRAAMSPFGRN